MKPCKSFAFPEKYEAGTHAPGEQPVDLIAHALHRCDLRKHEELKSSAEIPNVPGCYTVPLRPTRLKIIFQIPYLQIKYFHQYFIQ